MGEDKKFDPEKTVSLRWLVDNETGERVLVDTEAGKIIGRWSKNKNCPLCGKEK